MKNIAISGLDIIEIHESEKNGLAYIKSLFKVGLDASNKAYC